MILNKKVYTNYILKYFNFLKQDYNFSSPNFIDSQYHFTVEFLTSNLLLRIDYSYKNNTIMCTIFNQIDKIPPTNLKEDSSVTLAALNLLNNKFNKIKINYMSLMPSEIGLEESCNKISELLKKYADKILKGEEWISLSQIPDT